MLINLILFQQSLGQESNCTIFLTTTMGIKGLWDGLRGKEGGAERLHRRERKHRKRIDWDDFKVVLSMGPGSIFWKLEQGSLAICMSFIFFLPQEKWASSGDDSCIVS